MCKCVHHVCVRRVCTPCVRRCAHLGGGIVHYAARVLLAVSVGDISAADSVRVDSSAANARSVLDARQSADGRRSVDHTCLLLHRPAAHNRPTRRRVRLYTSTLLRHRHLYIRGKLK